MLVPARDALARRGRFLSSTVPSGGSNDTSESSEKDATPSPSSSATTSFGYKDVLAEEKEGMVREVFEKVAPSYDLMNDLMSAGVHRAWKDYLVSKIGVFPGMTHLDVAGGTGDVAFRVAEELSAWLPPLAGGAPPPLVVSDPNSEMLAVGRQRAAERGIAESCMVFEEGNAQSLPYADDSFDFVTISFGLRNVTDIDAALVEMRRVLKPGGRFECLEFSRVQHSSLRAVYDLYSRVVIPELGHRVADDRASYEYLVESIRKHPAQLELLSRVAAAGFKSAAVRDMTFGVVAVHSGYKL